MLVTLSGIIMLVRLVQLLKAYSPMLLTLLVMVILVRLVQPEKAPPPMLITLFGMVTLVSFLQRKKADFPMLVTLSGIVTLIRFSQKSKALFPILVTLLGIVIPTSVLQPSNLSLSKKALSGMMVIVLPERLRLTYLPDDFITSTTFSNHRSLMIIETFIGLSGLLAGCLSRNSFNASALFMV